MSCHSCGMPPGTTSNPGRHVEVTLEPEYGSKRQRKVKVWCCCDECAVQALGTAKWGPSHKWPISLAKFRSTVRFESNVR